MFNIGVVINQIESPFYSMQKSALIEWSKDKDIKLTFFTGQAIDCPDDYLRINNFTYGFIQSERLDGLIVYSGSLSNFIDINTFEQYIKKWSNIPIVSVNYPLSGYPSVISNSKKAIYDLVEHIVIHHKYRDVAIVSGPKNNFDSQERLNFFISALNGYGVEVDENSIFGGDFTPDSGKRAAAYFLERGLPEVIICLNDDMALNVIDVMKKEGISIPGDVAVTGFDSLDFTNNVFPSLTTIELPLKDISSCAIELLYKKIQGERVQQLTEIECKIISRQSCGCLLPKLEREDTPINSESQDQNILHKQLQIIRECINGKTDHKFLHNEFYKHLSSIDSHMDNAQLERVVSDLDDLYMINNMATAQIEYNKNYKFFLFHWVFSLISSRISSKLYFIEILQEIADSIPLLHFSFVKLFLYETPLDNSKEILEPERDIYLHLNSHKGEEIMISEEGVKTTIDEIYQADESTVIKTLSFSSEVFGILQLGVDISNDILFENIREVIGNALHLCLLNMNMQKTQRKLEASLAETRVLNNRLKYLSIRDEMTGLLNRRGFFEMVTDYMENRDKDTSYYLLYIDMDGLKNINDTYGHNEGDWAIINFSKALDHCFRVTDILARLGGDEFTALIAKDGNLTPDTLENRLEIELEGINQRYKKPYTISASVGHITFMMTEEKNINNLLEAADNALYKKKREKYSPS